MVNKILDEPSDLAMSDVKMNIPKQDAILNQTESFTPINIPDCYTKIAEIAFYKTERRFFESNRKFDDWIEEERELIAKNIPY